MCLPFTKNTKAKWRNNIYALAKELLKATFPYVIVCVLFIIFIAVNGSIVVGDKKAHTAVFHPMQVMYFLDFTAFMALPFFVTHVCIIYTRLLVE